jgi:phosphoglycolate phosphatase-like HAD superfamily hydrolase
LARSAAGSIYDEFLTAWLEMIESPEALNLDQLQEGAIECLRRWKAEGIHLTLVTMRQNKEALERQLALLELRPLLDSVLRCSHDAGGEGKAALVREKFPGLDYSAQALWVGDTEADWEAAQSLTCPIVLLANGLRNEEALSLLGPVEVVPSIASLINTI